MFRRFKISLFQPSKIAGFNNDSKLTIFIYYILLTFLAIIPYIILIFSSIGLNYDERLNIRNELRNQEIPYKIIDYTLTNYTEETEPLVINLSETTRLVFTEKNSEDFKYNPFHIGTIIVFSKDKVIYHTKLFEVIKINYSDYESLKELDFAGATNNDREFWDIVFPIINQEMNEHAPVKRIMDSIIILFAQALFLGLLSLIIAFFQRIKLQHLYSFGKIWQLTIYAMTPYIVLTLIGDLYNIGILSFIGVFVSYIYANQVANASINK